MNSIYNVFDSNIRNVTSHLDYYRVHLKSLSEVRSSGMIGNKKIFIMSSLYITVVDDDHYIFAFILLYFCCRGNKIFSYIIMLNLYDRYNEI